MRLIYLGGLCLSLAVVAQAQTVIGPIVGKAERSDTSKPLRELAADAEQAKRAAEEQLDAPTKVILKHLQAKNVAGADRGQIAPLADADLAKVWPKAAFYTLRFRQWPVAFEIPKGFSAGNICAIQGDEVTVLSDAPGLAKFLIAKLPATANEDDQRRAARILLRLAQELHQDGFYRFKPVDDKAIVIAKGQVAATAEVDSTGGNLGKVEGTLKFDPAGKLTDATTNATLKEGVRPICQATKLLDADPLVRRIAERDLIVMGRIALAYLLEQRAQASPELRLAIDQIWDKILADGR